MRIITCNIRTSGASDGSNAWSARRALCLAVIGAAAADIVCFQEMNEDQYDDARRALGDYDHYGLPDIPGRRRPVNAVFYRRAAFEPLAAAGYWLSPTPHVPGSRGWDSRCVRLANWVQLREKAGGRELRVVNTHLDHIGQEARENQASLLVADAAAWGEEYPQLLTGDFNCDRRNPAIARLLAGGWRDTYAAVHGPGDPGHTFHGFQGPAFRGETGKMDWVFGRGALRATAAAIIRHSENGRFPSDHYFVSADIELTTGET